MVRRSKNIQAAANAQAEARKTAGRNRLILNLMHHQFNTAKSMDTLKVEAAELEARHKLEAAALAQRHQTERTTLKQRHEIERKGHAAKATRTKKMHNTHRLTMTKTLKKAQNA
jgi:hypothetical protein